MSILRSSLAVILLHSLAILILGQVQVESLRITDHPVDTVVLRNEPIILHCQAEGLPVPSIQWFKNGRPLNLEPRHRVLLPTGSLFFLRVIHNKKDSDGGVYWCEASNGAKTVRSQSAKLDVAVLRDDFIQEPKNTRVALGETALLDCESPKGHPQPELYWLKDGKIINLQSSKRFRLVNGGPLMISDVKTEDVGDYQCVAENLAGTRKSALALLTVHVRPFFISAPQNVTVKPDDTARLQCHVGGEPIPIVRWHKVPDTSTLPASAILSDDYTLTIQQITIQDRGVYVCEAENTVGSVSANATITVQDYPEFTICPSNQTVSPNNMATFSCKGKGFPAPMMFWTVEGVQQLMFPGYSAKRYNVAKDNTLTIQALQEDSEHLMCLAVSKLGAVIVRAVLQVTSNEIIPAPPFEIKWTNLTISPPGTPQVLDSTQDSVTLSWSPSGLPSAVYMVLSFCMTYRTGWMEAASAIHSTTIMVVGDEEFVEGIYLCFRPLKFREHMESDGYNLITILNAGATSYTITGLNKYTWYSLFLLPFYKTVKGRPSNSWLVQTLEDVPSSPPDVTKVRWFNNTTAVAEWIPPPPDELNGKLLGFKVQVRVNGNLLSTKSVDSSTYTMIIHNASSKMSVGVCALTQVGAGPYSPLAKLDSTHVTTSAVRLADKGTRQSLPIITVVVIVLLSVLVFIVTFYIKRHQNSSNEMVYLADDNSSLPKHSVERSCKDLGTEEDWMSSHDYEQPNITGTDPTQRLSTFFSPKRDNPTLPYSTGTIVNNQISRGQIVGLPANTGLNLESKYYLSQPIESRLERRSVHFITLPICGDRFNQATQTVPSVSTRNISPIDQIRHSPPSSRMFSNTMINPEVSASGSSATKISRVPARDSYPILSPTKQIHHMNLRCNNHPLK